MKHFSFRLIIAITTLAIGISTVAVLFFRNPLPTIDLPQYPPECASESEAEIKNYSKIDWKWGFFPRFQELPLEKQTIEADETYRLLWIPTFDEPTVIRVWRSGEKSYITTKRLSRNQNNLEVGKLIFNQTRSLTTDEWNGFVNLVDHGCFWNLPSNINEIPVDDGASWTFEGLNNGDYHLVERTLPSEYMKAIYRSLFNLTKIEMEYEGYF